MRFIKAAKIFDGSDWLPPGTVLVYEGSGMLVDVTRESEVPAAKIETLEGILTPGFINAHCHLELSHLRDQVRAGTGFCAFALELMAKRKQTTDQEIDHAMRKAEREMSENGIVAVGDISNSSQSFDLKREQNMFYHTFVELLALNPARAEVVFAKGRELLETLYGAGLKGSLAAHAPYTVSNELLDLISHFGSLTNQPFSIHNQESLEETRFFMGEKSEVYQLYQELNIDLSFFHPPKTSSLSHYISHLGENNNLLVHNTFSTAADIDLAGSKDVFWVFCPAANLYIEESLPDFSLFAQSAGRICIGTDSLASNARLDVLFELNLLAASAPFFKEEQLLRMICLNGAQALKVEDRFGSLKRGGRAGLNQIRRNGTTFEFIAKLY